MSGVSPPSMPVPDADDVRSKELDAAEWVQPGGRSRPGESMVSRARGEVHEETGLSIVPGRCAFVLEVASPNRRSHVVVELVFLAKPGVSDYTVHTGEPGRTPVWLAVADIGSIPLRPPIGGHLRAFVRDSRASAAYLGNVWRPTGAGEDQLGEGGAGFDRSSP